METVDVAFAEEARIACSRALVKFATGQHDAAVEILTVFGEKCGQIVAASEMSAAQADRREDRFDLAALKVDLHHDQPEREAD